MLRSLSKSVSFHSRFFKNNIHIFAPLRIKEIFVKKENDKTTVIDCKHVVSPREPYLLKLEKKDDKCPLCRLKLDLKHTDVLILSQYIDSKGHLLKYKHTNLCWEQYKLVKELVYMAQYAGLLPEPPREEPKKPYQLLNTYYDEKTIDLKAKRTKFHMKYIYLSKRLGPIEKTRVKPNIGVYYGQQMT